MQCALNKAVFVLMWPSDEHYNRL